MGVCQRGVCERVFGKRKETEGNGPASASWMSEGVFVCGGGRQRGIMDPWSFQLLQHCEPGLGFRGLEGFWHCRRVQPLIHSRHNHSPAAPICTGGGGGGGGGGRGGDDTEDDATGGVAGDARSLDEMSGRSSEDEA